MSYSDTDTEEELSESEWPESGVTIETTDLSLAPKLADVVENHWLDYLGMRELLYHRVSKEYQKMFLMPEDPGWKNRPGQTKEYGLYIPGEVKINLAKSQNSMKRFMNKYFILENADDRSMELASLTFINGAGEPNISWRGVRDIDTVIPWINEITVKKPTYSDAIKAFNAIRSHKWDEYFDIITDLKQTGGDSKNPIITVNFM